MSELLFRRKVRVVVGPDGGIGRSFEGLHTIFTVEKTKSKHPNKATIQIYNLSDDSASYIESDEERLTVQLFAGYGGLNNAEPSLIFRGEIRKGKARTINDGVNRITRIEAKEGGRLFRSARINKSFSGQITASELLSEVGKSFGTTIKLPTALADVVLTQGYAASGVTRDVLSTLAVTLGFDWSFEDDVLTVTMKDGDTGETAVLLTPQTGLVGSPEKTSKGVNGVSLFNAGIRPKRIVEIRTGKVKGFFLVQKVTHKGDTHGNEFHTEFEGRSKRVAA